MATFVENTLNNLDSAITGYAANSFSTFAGPIATVCQLMGVVGLAFIALNALTQWVPIRIGEYLKWGIRYVIVTAVATSWAQFQPIYDIVTNTPGAIGAELMGIVGAPNLNTAFDAMITTLFDFSDRLADQASMFSISMASIVVWILGGLMAAAAIIVIALGKIGLAMAIALAPVFIPTLMFRATSNLFESWVRFTIGFRPDPVGDGRRRRGRRRNWKSYDRDGCNCGRPGGRRRLPHRRGRRGFHDAAGADAGQWPFGHDYGDRQRCRGGAWRSRVRGSGSRYDGRGTASGLSYGLPDAAR